MKRPRYGHVLGITFKATSTEEEPTDLTPMEILSGLLSKLDEMCSGMGFIVGDTLEHYGTDEEEAE